MPNPITNSPLQDKLYFRKTSSYQPAKKNSLGEFTPLDPQDRVSGEQYDQLEVEAFELSYNYKKPKEGILILKESLMFNVLENVLETLETQSKQLKYTESKPQPIEITKIKPPSQLQSFLKSFLKSFFPTKSPKFAITIQDLLDKAVTKKCLEEAMEIIEESQSEKDYAELEPKIKRYLKDYEELEPEVKRYLKNKYPKDYAELEPEAETTAEMATTQVKRTEPNAHQGKPNCKEPVNQEPIPEAETTAEMATTQVKREERAPTTTIIEGEPATTTTPLSFWQCLINPLGCCNVK